MICTTPTWQRTRKHRHCDWCGGDIEVGDIYVRWRCFEDAEAATCRVHPECDAAASKAALDSNDWEVELNRCEPRGGIDDPFDVATYEQALAAHEASKAVRP